MLLAGDLGGTKTLLGLFERDARRPRPTTTREFVTRDHGGLAEIVETFLVGCGVAAGRIEAATIGVAGPVDGGKVALTNIPWHINASRLGDRLGVGPITLLNDVEAMAYCVRVLDTEECVVLNAGQPDPTGNAALLSIGTGVGVALLHQVGGRCVPVASEGGHADFAARTEREIALLRALRAEHGRVEIERVVSGRGLGFLARFTHDGACQHFPQGLAVHDEPAWVTQAALQGTCQFCAEAMEMFVEALGAVAGDLALTAKATGGFYLGGGVPPKILSALRNGPFLAAFFAKVPMDTLLRRIPVAVITLSEAGLLGAAVHAGQVQGAAGSRAG